MIQRIQSLYLLIIAALTTITLFLPVAGLHQVDNSLIYELNYKGLYELNTSGNEYMANTWMLTALMVIIPLLSFINIFLFKNRFLQLRMVFFNIVIMAGFYVMLFIYLWQFGKIIDAKMFVEIPAAFPLIGIVLSIMTIKSISKDIALIKSLNRIR
ncbi:MAG: hypothetical protein BGO29_15100 [Bacteroidales bacterium 36-12]|nr:MAG: hypothetical protein BGO29_15100 [Bacteroidales bacterium 36-12]